MNNKKSFDGYFMREAIKEARKALKKDEVPVGAVIIKNGSVIARAHNSVEKNMSSLMHAEIKAIKIAQKKTKNWRLTGCELYVTLEPCLMCSGAIILSRISRLVYGARDPKAGAVESLYKTLSNKRLNHRVEITGGILEKESSSLLKTFFRERRKGLKPRLNP